MTILSKTKYIANISAVVVACAGTFHLKHYLLRSKHHDLSKKENKKIVIVGAGIVGLTTAYYLSKNPRNQVTIIERNSKPYQGSSLQNGCQLMTQCCESWINKPFYMFLQAINKNDGVSKVYPISFFNCYRNSLATLKFGYLWFFFQSNKETFGKNILKLLESTETLLNEFLEVENIKSEEVGYRKNTKLLMLQNNNNFSDYKSGINFEKHPHYHYDRSNNNDKFQKDIDDNMPQMPAIQTYEFGMLRSQPTLDTARLGNALYQKLQKKQNVNFMFNSIVSQYIFDDQGLVKSVIINEAESELCTDVVVLCNGPQGRLHLFHKFQRTILPMVSAQGYSVNLHNFDSEKSNIDTDMQVKNAFYGYVYSQLEPGKHRIVGFFDIGMQDYSFIDKMRVKHFENIISKDFIIEKPDYQQTRSCLRPQSYDDMPIIGQMARFPNVVLNMGHGSRGTSICFATAKIVQNIVEGGEYFDEGVMKMVNSQRCYV